jgi:uridylate kinase
MTEVNPRRVLLKLSGEALGGASGSGIEPQAIAKFASEIAAARRAGYEIAVVVGGGNIFRGVSGAARGMDRPAADTIGMLATVMNGIALTHALQEAGAPARTLSALDMPTACETYIRNKALADLERGEVVVLVGGTGNPFFTTDTTATLRAAELRCAAVLKATQVDGVYSADPKKDPSATRYESLTYQDVLERDLKVMDAAAIALARDNAIPVIVFDVHSPGALLAVLEGRGRFTTVRAAA